MQHTSDEEEEKNEAFHLPAYQELHQCYILSSMIFVLVLPANAYLGWTSSPLIKKLFFSWKALFALVFVFSTLKTK